MKNVKQLVELFQIEELEQRYEMGWGAKFEGGRTYYYLEMPGLEIDVEIEPY